MTEEHTSEFEGSFQSWHRRTRRRLKTRDNSTRCAAGCSTPIEPGDAYWAGMIADGGSWSTCYLHVGCWEEGQRQAAEHGSCEYLRIAEGAMDDGYAFDQNLKTWVDMAPRIQRQE